MHYLARFAGIYRKYIKELAMSVMRIHSPSLISALGVDANCQLPVTPVNPAMPITQQ
jgi:hypothetical protein